MTFIARMLKYLFWLLLVSWSVGILRKIVGSMAPEEAGLKRDVDVANDAVHQKLVRDPVCGMHVAEGLALSVQQGGETVHFCSAECRDKFFDGNRKISASA